MFERFDYLWTQSWHFWSNFDPSFPPGDDQNQKKKKKKKKKKNSRVEKLQSLSYPNISK